MSDEMQPFGAVETSAVSISTQPGEIICIKQDGRILWRGREVETDDDFRAAMLDLRDSFVRAQNESTMDMVPRGTVERQAARIAELEKDAARYRWLRHIDRRGCLVLTGPAAGCWIDAEEEDGTLVLLTEEDADAAIDAAMGKP